MALILFFKKNNAVPKTVKFRNAQKITILKCYDFFWKMRLDFMEQNFMCDY